MLSLKATTHYEEHLNRDVDLIRSKILAMAQLADRALRDSLQALVEKNLTLAYSVILRDQYIDELEKEIDRLCLEFLVRQQPAAVHLRFAYATIKINLELERIGDYAESIARQVLKVSALHDKLPLKDFSALANVSIPMLRNATKAFIEQDAKLAREAMEDEDKADVLRGNLDAELLQLFQSGAIPLTALNPLQTIARRFERVADQAKNICEETLYMCTGEYVKHRGAEVLRILFVDENNSCRSQMAEGIANTIKENGFVFSSAGLEARAIDWRTVEFLQEKGIDISQQKPKSVSQIPHIDHYHVIIALAKNAKKVFPPPPTKTVGLDWTVEDPSTRPGSLADVRDAYEQTFQYINTHVKELVQALVEDSQ
ncbi:MAG TPA: phosphate signaling complex protein PhoU [Candidatus Limnocylindria bacterium]|nr:phosphate signaling complex protein PhoU [Candidatus Limnocylindria bacterium]